jgi:hypothetical protein
MSTTMLELEQLLIQNKIGFMSVSTPNHNGTSWQVNLREGPGWTVGEFCPTFEEALQSSLSKPGRFHSMNWKPPVKDDLEDLLG